VIYFIRSPAGPIKIGTTTRLSHRLKQLAAEHGEGLEVLAVTEGSFGAERELHGRFAHLRTVGEWFEPGSDLMGFIVADGKSWDGHDEVPGPVAVKMGRAEHSKLRIVAAHQNRDLADLLTEIVKAPIDRLWKTALKEQGEQAEGEAKR